MNQIEEELNTEQKTIQKKIDRYDSFKKELDKWEKSRDLLIDIASFEYEIKLNGNNLTISNLFRKIIKGLEEDTYYHITYKSDYNYDDIYLYLKKQFKILIDKYPEYNDILKKISVDDFSYYLHDNIHRYVYMVNSNEYREEKLDYNNELKKGYNLIKLCLEYGRLKELYGFIISDVDTLAKDNMIIDMIFSSKKIGNIVTLLDEYDTYSFIPHNAYSMVKDREVDVPLNFAKRKFEEAFKNYDNYINYDNKKYGLLDNLDVRVLNKLQQKKLIDFNELYFTTLENKTVGTPVKILNKKDGIHYLKSFYDADSYLEYSDLVRENTDNYIMDSLLHIKYVYPHIKDLLSYKNFKITDNIIDMVISYINAREISEKNIDKICDTIIRRASNKEEYKQYLRYVKNLKENTNKEELTNSRQKLVKTLVTIQTYKNKR